MTYTYLVVGGKRFEVVRHTPDCCALYSIFSPRRNWLGDTRTLGKAAEIAEEYNARTPRQKEREEYICSLLSPPPKGI